MNAPLLVALFGGTSMATFALGLWLPAYLRHRAVRRRLSGFVQAGAAGGLAVDLGGRRRARTTKRVANEQARSIIGWLTRMIVQAHVDVSVGEVIAATALLSFLAFSADLGRFEIMLARMFGTTGDGLSDRLLAFTKPVSGSFFFAPSIEDLAEIC